MFDATSDNSVSMTRRWRDSVAVSRRVVPSDLFRPCALDAIAGVFLGSDTQSVTLCSVRIPARRAGSSNSIVIERDDTIQHRSILHRLVFTTEYLHRLRRARRTEPSRGTSRRVASSHRPHRAAPRRAASRLATRLAPRLASPRHAAPRHATRRIVSPPRTDTIKRNAITRCHTPSWCRRSTRPRQPEQNPRGNFLIQQLQQVVFNRV